MYLQLHLLEPSCLNLTTNIHNEMNRKDIETSYKYSNNGCHRHMDTKSTRTPKQLALRTAYLVYKSLLLRLSRRRVTAPRTTCIRVSIC
jgi:hypothetical protein